MSSLWYAGTIGGKRRRRHMGPFLINTVEPSTSSGGINAGTNVRSASSVIAGHRQRGTSVPTTLHAQRYHSQGTDSAKGSLSSPSSLSQLSPANSTLRETMVPPRRPTGCKMVRTTTIPLQTPIVVKQPIRRTWTYGQQSKVVSPERRVKLTCKEPSWTAIYSAPKADLIYSSTCTISPAQAKMIPENINEQIEIKDVIKEKNHTKFVKQQPQSELSEPLENPGRGYENSGTNSQKRMKSDVIVAVEPPSTSVTSSSTMNSLNALCEREVDADEHDALLGSPVHSTPARKNALMNFRLFNWYKRPQEPKSIRRKGTIQLSRTSIIADEKTEHASTSTSTFSDEHASLLSSATTVVRNRSAKRTPLKRCLSGIFRNLSRTEGQKEERTKAALKQRSTPWNGDAAAMQTEVRPGKGISLVHFRPKKSSSSAEISFSQHTSSITSCCTPPYNPQFPYSAHNQRRTSYHATGPAVAQAQSSHAWFAHSQPTPSLPPPPPFYHPQYAGTYPPFQFINRSYSPTYYTTSRKVNRASRMTQGPQRYFFFSDIVLDFCARTSSHGIPFIGTHSFFGRIIWSVITIFAFLAFCIQTYYTLYDYLQYRTIIEMQLKFEPAPFPAATLCNLNSFKYSELRKFEEIGQGFKLWEEAISKLDRDARNRSGRVRRQITYRPVYARCVCTQPGDECVPQRNELDTEASVCICFEDAHTGDIWPCYSRTDWVEKTCFHCSNADTCEHPDKPLAGYGNLSVHISSESATFTGARDCICQSVSHYCLARNHTEDIRWWDPYNYTVFPATEPPTASPEIAEAFGLDNLHDRGAITTRTKENLIFLVAAMPRETRRQLSYNLDEFVLRCSFNSKDCDLERDFQIQIDPEYGNCYTFNFNDSVELKNSRAGPMYGLRLLLNVNQSDYMPTTEAAGVRLVVHEQDQEPFPDTFGYSAPTGFVSSFGLKTKVLNRLDAPYGKCSDTFRPEGYIYAEHYSPEGCYRNCFQQIIIKRCGCGDPRFPMPLEGDVKPCDARAPAERACLANETSVLGGFHHLTHDCHCIQPCTENVFETAYSAAAWPALNFKIGEDCASVLGEEAGNFTQAECTEYYRRNTAYIEIYYEQLNFEYLKETAGYTMVNLFSDLGGNIGLWIGFSLITVLEFIEFFCECIAFGLRSCFVQRLLGRRRMSSHCSRSGSRTESVRNGRVDLIADNYSSTSAQAESAAETGHAAAALTDDECQRLTPRRASIADDKKQANFYYYYDPRRNSAVNKQWRRRVWEQQQRQWEEWRRQQEQLLLQQQQQEAADEGSSSARSGGKGSSTVPSLAAAAFSVLGMPKSQQGMSLMHGSRLQEEKNDRLSAKSTENLSNRSKCTVGGESAVTMVSIQKRKSISNADESELLPMHLSESINLMRFESADDDGPRSSAFVKQYDDIVMVPAEEFEKDLHKQKSAKQAQGELDAAPPKPPVSESLRLSFKKENPHS